MNGVSQDSEALRQDANYINEMAETFKSQYEQLFQEMEANLSADANESIAWWGPQAGLFLNNFNKKKEDFNNAYKNVTSMATNLEEQAQAWDTFENAQYIRRKKMATKSGMNYDKVEKLIEYLDS